MQSDPSDRYQQASDVKTDVSSIPLRTAAPSPNLSLKGEGKAARAAQSDPSPLRGERLGEGSVARTQKSRAPLLLGLLAGAVVIAVGAFVVLKKPAQSGPLTPVSGTSNAKAPAAPPQVVTSAKPAAAVSPSPSLPITKPYTTATVLPESGWKPLVADAVWRAASPDREFADGLLHIKRNTTGSGIIMPQSTADAAIRARIRIRNGTSGPMIQLRQVTNKGRYMAGLYRPADGGYHVSLLRRTEGGKQEALGTYPLPQSPREGDTLALELRAQEDRLTVLVDGIVRIEANDKAIREAGNWGIQANEAWFESVEVQPLPTAATPASIAAPALPESGWQPLFTDTEWRTSNEDHEFVEGLLHVKRLKFLPKAQQPSADGAIRAKVLIRKGAKDVCVFVRKTPATSGYKLMLRPQTGTVYLSRDEAGVSHSLGMQKFTPDPRQANDGVILELRAQGSHLTALVDSVVLIDAEDNTLNDPGEWGITATDAWFESVEVQPIPAAATPTPIAATALPESGWKPLFTETEWRASNDDYEFAEGLLHVKRPKFLPRTQPSADGAIRARIIYREGTRSAFVVARSAQADGHYVLGLGTDAKHVFLGYFKSLSAEGNILARHFLPRPLALGDGLLLELILQGDHLTGVVNGVPVMEAHDTQLTQPGRWGIYAAPAWFESVEVQPLPTAATPASIAAPALPESGWQPLFTEAELKAKSGFKDGQLNLSHAYAAKPQNWNDGAIRTRIQFQDGSKVPSLVARQIPSGIHYRLGIGSTGDHLFLSHSDPKGSDPGILTRQFLPVGLKPGDKVLLELRVQGDRLTGLLDGKVALEAQDSRLQAPGQWGITAIEGWFESVEVQPLPAAATAEIWEDLLHDPAKLELSGAWERAAEGLRLSGTASAKLRPLLAATRRDQAIRMRAVFGGIRPGLMVPAIAPYDRYQLFIRGDNSLVLDKASTTNSHADLREFALPTRIRAGQEYELEMRVDGQTLSVKFNGQTLGTLTDVEFRDGRVQIANIDANGSPTLINKLEVLDLSLSEKGSPSPNLPVSKSSATTSPPAWNGNDWIAEKRHAGAFASHPQLRDEPTGLRITADPSAELFIGSTFRNGRVRISCVAPESGGEVPLFLRSKSEAGITGRYQVAVSKKSGIKIQLFHTPSGGEMKWTELKTWPLPKDFDWAREYALELAAMNDLLTVSLNGKEVGSVQDTKLTGAGSFGFSALKDTRITKVEYQSLDGSAAAAVSPTPNFPVSKSSALTFNGHRYQLISTPSTWAEAKAKAEAMGGHLATFTTEAEERWARETILRPLSTQESASTKAPDQLYWIGGTAAAQSKDFRWLSGEPVGKIGWRSGNPGWRERTDMPETKAVGTLFAASLVVMRPHPSGEWISVQQQSLLRSGFIIEWDDAGGTSSVSPAPNLPVSKSSDPKFPPGQWVKLFTKPEDLPADLRKPDSGVTWEDGWIRNTKSAPSTLPLPRSLVGNIGVRFHQQASWKEGKLAATLYLKNGPASDGPASYMMQINSRGEMQVQKGVGEQKFLPVAVRPLPPSHMALYEIDVEYAIAGARIVTRAGGTELIVAQEAISKKAPGHLNLYTAIRDIEVINLDGLPEAEALRLLGVDEQGNDLRGKAGASAAEK
jgi:hypothetical protein